jgi:hypothetical protein
MANKLMRKLGFGSYADQLVITGSYSSPSATSATPSSDTGAWANVAATAITVAGRTAASIWAPQPQAPVAPAYPGAGMPAGSVMGSIDSKILLIGGIAVLGIVLMLAMKK